MPLPLLQAKLLLQLQAAAGNWGRKAKINNIALLRIPPAPQQGQMQPAADLDLPFGCFTVWRHGDEGGMFSAFGVVSAILYAIL